MGVRPLRFLASLGLLLSVALAPLSAAGPPPRPREGDTADRVDAAIDLMLKEIRDHPYVPAPRPPSPDRSGMGSLAEDR